MYLARVGLSVAVCSLAACLGGTTAGAGDEGPQPEDRNSTRRIVISMSEQATPPSLISVLEMRVRNMDVRRHSGDCPQIEFRGRSSISAPTAPSVYVDGQHASNTCVLDLISPVDVSYLEVYPMGVADRVGYFSSAGGLILVFTKNGRM